MRKYGKIIIFALISLMLITCSYSKQCTEHAREEFNKHSKKAIGNYHDAYRWYADFKNDFKHSDNYKKAKKYAVVVWSKPNTAGHVAFVKKVDKKKGITITEANWSKKTDGKSVKLSWDQVKNRNGYKFVGYIYAKK